jgi:hypothetical protein
MSAAHVLTMTPPIFIDSESAKEVKNVVYVYAGSFIASLEMLLHEARSLASAGIEKYR